MTENIYDLANNLERAIRALPEYKAVLEAKQAVLADTASSELWQEFMVTQTEVQDLLQAGELPSKEMQEKMQSIGQQIEGNQVLKTYFEQQQRLYVYVADLEKIIFAPLNDLGK